MAVFELARFKVEPDKANDMLASRDAMVDAVRERFPGLIEASLARLDEVTWIDVWKWESLEQAKAAAAGAPEVPEAGAMFSLISKVEGMEHATIVHER
ncbi:MAG: antibiotic biosynthesis monooxygenase [Actinomycetota bacterium]|nr:antibiotic biosynthesis monooxygenase [Actinomycetota bacterium]